MAMGVKRRASVDPVFRNARPALAVVGAFALVLFIHGCATTPDQQEARAEKEYRTGSNIPIRDRNSPGDAKSYDPASVQDALRRSMPPTPAGMKGG